MKKCNGCGIDKDESEFRKQKCASGNYKLYYLCKSCVKQKDSDRYSNESMEDRAKREEKRKAWRAQNRDKVLALKKKYRMNKKVIRLASTPNDAHVKAWESHLNKLARLASSINDAHVNTWKSDDARYARWKHKHDISYAINQRLRVAIRKAMKGNKAGRQWESIVGYTLDDIKNHFIKTMPKGRSIEDMFNGNLHIDHIVPKSLFDLSNDNDIQKAWSLTNLRLIDATENLKKSNKCIYLL